MKRTISWLLLISIALTLTACVTGLTSKKNITTLYRRNESAFLAAASSGDFDALINIHGVQKVYVSDTYVDIQCGGSGIGSSTAYYGIFYSADDDLYAIDLAGPSHKLVKHGNGYLYQEDNGDNRYYVEPLGNHFYYYEAHF